MHGRIVSWFPEKHFGFVHPSVPGNDLLFHASEILEGGVPRVGARVEYKRAESPTTNPRTVAVAVRIK
jgi:cold shock CspA family protein